jgi:hypothetical protein
VCKVRGIKLNYSASKLVNFDVVRDMTLRGDESEHVMVRTENKIKRKRAGGIINIVTEPEDKMYSLIFQEKAASRQYIGPFRLPIKEGDGCTVRSVMSHDLRFKHPFSCIIAGPSASGKSSFCIQLLQNLKSLCTKPSFDGGILWCYGEDNTVPSLPFASGKLIVS